MPEAIPIVGGGIAGLTSALCLAHLGLASHVHEQAGQFDEVGAGIQLSPNAMSVLDALGLAEALQALAVAPERIAIRDGHRDRPIAEVPLGAIAQARHGAPYLVIHRADLQRVLVDACEAHMLVGLTRGATIAPDQEVALLIAADGVHSSWRGRVRADPMKHFTGHVAWRAVEAVAEAPNSGETRIWLGRKAHLVAYPIRAGRARNLVAIARADDPRPVRADPSAVLAQAFSGWDRSLSRDLLARSDWTPWPLFGVDPQAAWTDGRIALVGDAAHAMLPFAAQGGAMAIEDAWVLAHALANARSAGKPVAHALGAYEAARKPRVTRVWNEAVRNGRTYHLAEPMALARNAVLRARSGAGLLARYDWLYGWKAAANRSA